MSAETDRVRKVMDELLAGDEKVQQLVAALEGSNQCVFELAQLLAHFLSDAERNLLNRERIEFVRQHAKEILERGRDTQVPA